MKVSVVTPSYNQGRFIKRTLESVASQGGVEIDHVVFDGGSTDETVDVLKHFGGNLRWVSETDNGQTDAVNKGIRATNGEIIGWLNSDDIYYPDAIARVVAVFNGDPTIDVVYGRADHIDVSDFAFEAYPTAPWDFEHLKRHCFICQPAAFFRRSVVERYGLLDEKLNFCMDYEYWLRLGKMGAKFAFLDEKLAGSRLYAENKTMGSRLKVSQEIVQMQKATLGRVAENWLWTYARVSTEERIDRSKNPMAFGWTAAVTMVKASIRWNRQLSPQLRETLLQQACRVPYRSAALLARQTRGAPDRSVALLRRIRQKISRR